MTKIVLKHRIEDNEGTRFADVYRNVAVHVDNLPLDMTEKDEFSKNQLNDILHKVVAYSQSTGRTEKEKVYWKNHPYWNEFVSEKISRGLEDKDIIEISIPGTKNHKWFKVEGNKFTECDPPVESLILGEN